ncbi:IS66 family insertion sequence element accessory protein TnpB [Polaromonas sp.]|uniref:IS66 family insertion sequence element accessory protein TnpB n=1 Tax=Polaromonas sp. TaxID=1869339 RepID=UPI001834CABB|nr:IS66 family insertion sequence element accessory protein TnpB [Polaromonas sp.]NMM08313.1 IS66 family insertion sequence element accessory protein TnpB [Polaromonas sp.]
METKKVMRRKHGAEFRAEVLQACRQSGAFVAAIALSSGLNANVAHRWLSRDGRTRDGGGGNRGAVTRNSGTEFLPLQLPQPAVATPSPDIRVEVRRGASSVTVNWPLQASSERAARLRNRLR